MFATYKTMNTCYLSLAYACNYKQVPTATLTFGLKSSQPILSISLVLRELDTQQLFSCFS